MTHYSSNIKLKINRLFKRICIYTRLKMFMDQRLFVNERKNIDADVNSIIISELN